MISSPISFTCSCHLFTALDRNKQMRNYFPTQVSSTLVYQRKQSSIKTDFNAKAMTGNLPASCRHRVHHWIESQFLILKFQHIFFITEESEAASRQVLEKSEQIRRFQEENKHLGQLVTNPSPQRPFNFLFFLFSTDVKRSKFGNTYVSSYNSCSQERHKFVESGHLP